MKKAVISLILVCLLAGSLVLAGCTSTAGDGKHRDTSLPTVKIGDILDNPKNYNGTSVLISGKVVNQCGSGCWFFLNDGSGSIYVDLLPNNFAIPPMLGSKVAVKGDVLVEGGDVSILGSSVITDLKVYP